MLPGKSPGSLARFSHYAAPFSASSGRRRSHRKPNIFIVHFAHEADCATPNRDAASSFASQTKTKELAASARRVCVCASASPRGCQYRHGPPYKRGEVGGVAAVNRGERGVTFLPALCNGLGLGLTCVAQCRSPCMIQFPWAYIDQRLPEVKVIVSFKNARARYRLTSCKSEKTLESFATINFQYDHRDNFDRHKTSFEWKRYAVLELHDRGTRFLAEQNRLVHCATTGSGFPLPFRAK